MGLGHQNVVIPHLMTAKLSSEGGVVDCQLHDETGNPTDGVIVIDNEAPFTEIHIELRNDDAEDLQPVLFRVSAEMVVTDGYGRNRTTHRTSTSLYLFTYMPSR